jgi:SAM-dependent methyltransferase
LLDKIASHEKKLRELFEFFKIDNLKGIDAVAFEDSILGRIGGIDANSERYRDDELSRQRDLSIKFHWGHDHDFGSFNVSGKMGQRHIQLMAKFLAFFDLEIESFSEKNVLDIGCWTGGTTLLLSRLAKSVSAVEEVRKYANTVQFMINHFDLSDRVSVLDESLYKLNDEKYFDKYDRVHFPGVIYHLSDPVLALRILFNSLTIGGDILVETAGIDTEESMCLFEGNFIFHSGGTREELNRGGWNWFKPSPNALGRMMLEAGFEDIRTLYDPTSKRVFGYGKKMSQNPICKAGLSVPDIR